MVLLVSLAYAPQDGNGLIGRRLIHDDRLEPDSEWEDLRRLVAEIVGALVEGIREARFPVHSADDNCGRFCPFRTICRINQVRSLEKTWQRAPSQA